jgi:hypothetical protein
MAPARKPAVRRAKRLPPDSALATAAATTVAEFVPLPYGDAFGPPERAQVMRVTMPRAALTGLGLPLRYDRPDELIRADILFGEDSIARAIRLVDRNQTSRPTARRANYER